MINIEGIKEQIRVSSLAGIKKQFKEVSDAALIVDSTIPVVSSYINTKDEDIFRSIGTGISFLGLLGKDFEKRALEMFSHTGAVPCFPVRNQFTTFITFSTDDKTHEVDKSSGRVGHFKTPLEFDLSSPLWFAHEGIHAFKDVNYDEYVLKLNLGDVIPMFMELLIANNVGTELGKIYLKNRLFLLKEQNDLIDEANNNSELSLEGKEFIKANCYQYFASYYYALCLYDKYRTKPNEVMVRIKEVLNKRKTTLDILKELCLYDLDKSRFRYDKTLNNIRGRIK